MTLEITKFSFDDSLPERSALAIAWLSAIQDKANEQIKCEKTKIFFISIAKLVARTGILHTRGLKAVILASGYSKSTFFRIFPSYKDFLLKSYHISSNLSIDIYADALSSRELDADEFCKLSIDILYGAHCVLPNEISQIFWPELQQSEVHPHLDRLTSIMINYLKQNPKTEHLQIDRHSLDQTIKSMDWDILRTRVEPNENFPDHKQYWRFRNQLKSTISPTY